jgi:hypothetical protein
MDQGNIEIELTPKERAKFAAVQRNQASVAAKVVADAIIAQPNFDEASAGQLALNYLQAVRGKTKSYLEVVDASEALEAAGETAPEEFDVRHPDVERRVWTKKLADIDKALKDNGEGQGDAVKKMVRAEGLGLARTAQGSLSADKEREMKLAGKLLQIAEILPGSPVPKP